MYDTSCIWCISQSSLTPLALCPVAERTSPDAKSVEVGMAMSEAAPSSCKDMQVNSWVSLAS